jgi:signal transduction histidine kinase
MQVRTLLGLRREHVVVPRYALATFALLALTAGVVVFGDPDLVSNVAALGILVGDVVAGVVFVRRAQRLHGAEKRAWSLVGFGLIVATSGIAVLAIQVLAGSDPPTFGVSDVCFLTGYVIILVGISSLPHTAGDRLQRWRVALDGVIGAISIGALAWIYILDPIIVGLDEAPLTDQVFGTLYPLVDVGVVVVVMIVTIRRSALRFDIRLFLFTGAVLFQGIADVSYLVEGAGRSYAEAEPLFVVYLGAAALFLMTALLVDRVPEPREQADRHIPLWSMMIPYSAAVVMIVVLLSHLWDTTVDASDRVLLVATVLVAVAVVVRQGISIRENRAIVERERTDLVSSISHELRTPLTATLGFMSILQADPKLDLEERIEMIDVVVDQTRHLERIVQDLLLLAHDQSGDVTLRTAEWRIEPLVEASVLASGVGGGGTATEVEPGLTGFVDAGRIQQILTNLITNARNYGGGSCLVVAHGVGDRLVFEVHDAGPGVPKKHELVIWDRFERGAYRYNAAVPGTGIGLSMVKRIAAAHGGRAWYRTSERLGGACFAVEFPGRVADPAPIAVAHSSTMAIG